jgi:Ca2+-binding EF-hand superfamily protein
MMDGISELARVLNTGSIIDKLEALDTDADGIIPAEDLRAYAKEQRLHIPADALEHILSAFSRDSNSVIHIEDLIQVHAFSRSARLRARAVPAVHPVLCW